MERRVPEAEAGEYRVWLASPSVSAQDSDEMVIAWNLGRALGLHPTRVLRSLRAERGFLALEMERVMAAVEADPDVVLRGRYGKRTAGFRRPRRFTRKSGGAPPRW